MKTDTQKLKDDATTKKTLLVNIYVEKDNERSDWQRLSSAKGRARRWQVCPTCRTRRRHGEGEMSFMPPWWGIRSVEFPGILRRLSKIILSSHHHLLLYAMVPKNFCHHVRRQERAGALHQPSAVVVALAVVDICGLFKLHRFTRQRQCSLMEVGLITTGNHSVKLQILCSLLISRFLLNRCI